MKMSPGDVPALLGAYVDQEVAPKASGLQKFGAYAGVFVVQNRAAHLLQDPKIKKLLASSGALDEAGLLDVDYLHNMAKFAMNKAGGTVTVAGLILDGNDVESLYKLAQSFAR